MPVILDVFLSEYVFLILLWIYFAAAVAINVGFRLLGIKRRRDVIIRGTVMFGTFIFLSHSIGVMVISIVYIFLRINSIVQSRFIGLLMVICAAAVSDTICFFSSGYLWDRLAIDSDSSLKLSLYGLVIVTPWYFIINII